MKASKTAHQDSGHLHNGNKIEPCMVLDETASQSLVKQDGELKSAEQIPEKVFEVEHKPQQKRSSKVKKGKWIVKLERINV